MVKSFIRHLIIILKYNKSKLEFLLLKTENQKNRYIDNLQKQLKALFIAIVGNSIDLKTIFNNDDYKPSDENQIPRGGDFKYGNDNFE